MTQARTGVDWCCDRNASPTMIVYRVAKKRLRQHALHRCKSTVLSRHAKVQMPAERECFAVQARSTCRNTREPEDTFNAINMPDPSVRTMAITLFLGHNDRPIVCHFVSRHSAVKYPLCQIIRLSSQKRLWPAAGSRYSGAWSVLGCCRIDCDTRLSSVELR